MVFQKTTFERIFSFVPVGTGLMTAHTSFGFEANGSRHFVVTAPGKPRIEQGMTVIALLEKPSCFGSDSLLGWVDCDDGLLMCNSPLRHFWLFLINIFAAITFADAAYFIVSPVNADMVAAFVTAVFGCLVLYFLYLFVRAFLVKRALVAVRDFSKAIDGEPVASGHRLER